MKENYRGRLTPELKRRHWSEKAKLILSHVTKIEAKLHMIRFSGNYNFDPLKNKIGPLYDQTERNWNTNYDKRYIRNFSNFMLEVFVNPTYWQYMPLTIISIYPQNDISIDVYKKFLKGLQNRLPNLNVSAVEYTLDIFCSNPTHVGFMLPYTYMIPNLVVSKFICILVQ